MFPVTITVHNAVQLNAVVNAMEGLPVANTSPVGGIAPQHHDSRTITPTAPTAAEVVAHRDQNGGTMAAAKAAVTKAKAAEAKKPAPEPEQPSNPSTGTTSGSEQSGAQLDTGELAGDEKPYTLTDAQDLTKKVVAAGKRNEMVALLAKYEAKVAAQLKPEQFAPFCVDAEGLLK